MSIGKENVKKEIKHILDQFHKMPEKLPMRKKENMLSYKGP